MSYKVECLRPQDPRGAESDRSFFVVESLDHVFPCLAWRHHVFPLSCIFAHVYDVQGVEVERWNRDNEGAWERWPVTGQGG